MAAFRKTPPAPVKPRGFVASAAQFTFGGAQTWQNLPSGDRRWQQEAWYQYDINGELRYATGWKGNACSQALLYAADVDPLTGKPLGPTENPTVQKITDSILGGPVRRPQHVRTIAVNLDVAGEVYVLVLAGKGRGQSRQPDEWLVVSATEMKSNGGRVEYTNPKTGGTAELGPDDKIIRIWMPHPRLQFNADSAVRALLPTLREIEKASQNIAARLDSRLAGAGILTFPAEVEFPDQDDSEPSEPGGLLGLLAKSMRASLSDPGSAASQVPITLEVPSEFADGIRHITFETPLSKEIIELRDSSIARFAAGMDLPREVVEGMGESNHWSSWQVEEATYKTHLMPLLDLISDAITVAYLTPILTEAKVANPERYMLAFDGTALIGQPDPLAEALELYDRGAITAEALRTITSTPEEYAPQGEERLLALAERLVTQAPTLIQDPEIRRLLGFKDAPTPIAPLPSTPALPAPEGDTGGDQGPPSRTASLAAASLAVTYALERVGNKILNTERLKAEFGAVPRHELYLKIRPAPGQTADLLAGAWRHTPQLAADMNLDAYVRTLLATGSKHTEASLAEWVRRRV